MNRLVPILILLARIPFAGAVDLGVWRDLHVTVDSPAEPVLVNGQSIVVSRATGSDVNLLVGRLSRKWSEEGGDKAVRAEASGTWTVLSRIHDTGLEVMQWRGTGKDMELLLSRSELLAGSRAPEQEVIRFPAGCVPGRSVSGRLDARSWLQRTAHCNGSPRTVLLTMRGSASRQGFEVLAQEGQFLARRHHTEISVRALRGGEASSAGTALIYLQLEFAEHSQ
jgi:hypothetical protein